MLDILSNIGNILGSITKASVATSALKDVADPAEKSEKGDIGSVVAGGGFQKLADTLREGGVTEQKDGVSTSAPNVSQEQDKGLNR
ncbi:MAG: hypothetical protein PQ612_03450 [Rickettsiales bacterium]|nr:hypothetical protein [Pseudomonadota bacterium]MDA0965832.1 hypothetical protein [Pseudomonadota bacterium]MDG4542698.1 hypothetical protein [Rickettsiales bacterium]MDG4545202.1 hypothetical protein [Rickettsiales bacterium]MDG4547325.1 hypothetical protein [Rickettsiales bacterium]